MYPAEQYNGDVCTSKWVGANSVLFDQWFLVEHKFELVQHSTFSPDLTPYDLFLKLKIYLIWGCER